MKEILQNSNIAIVGGGRVCNAILEIVLGENFLKQKLNISGVADINDKAQGLTYAREKGIFTTLDYRDLKTHIRELEKIETEFDHFSQQLAKIVEERTRHLQTVERELVERERALAQPSSFRGRRSPLQEYSR